jgi:hypothetical protein
MCNRLIQHVVDSTQDVRRSQPEPADVHPLSPNQEQAMAAAVACVVHAVRQQRKQRDAEDEERAREQQPLPPYSSAESSPRMRAPPSSLRTSSATLVERERADSAVTRAVAALQSLVRSFIVLAHQTVREAKQMALEVFTWAREQLHQLTAPPAPPSLAYYPPAAVGDEAPRARSRSRSPRHPMATSSATSDGRGQTREMQQLKREASTPTVVVVEKPPAPASEVNRE